MTLHKDLTGDEIHEPKGIVVATVGMVYVANGSGSGTWKKVGVNEINKTALPGLLQFNSSFTHLNINTTRTAYSVVPESGSLTSIFGIVDATVTTDTTINFLKNGSISIGTVIIPAGSVAGYLFNLPVTPLSFVQGDFITANSNGTGSSTCTLEMKLAFNYP